MRSRIVLVDVGALGIAISGLLLVHPIAAGVGGKTIRYNNSKDIQKNIA
ncbi:MAG: hypothetical protein WBQ25_17785 [Nitrososphaeraceae archaeon]